MHEFCISLRQLYGDSRKFLLLGEAGPGRPPRGQGAGTAVGGGRERGRPRQLGGPALARHGPMGHSLGRGGATALSPKGRAG